MGMARWFGDLRASPCFFYRNEQMNTRELAATFKVSRTQPHRWIKQGCPVPHSKCSRSPLRWSEQDVHAVREWLAARGNAAKSRTLRDVAKNLRVCLATLWTYRRAGCPMPPVRQDWSARRFLPRSCQWNRPTPSTETSKTSDIHAQAAPGPSASRTCPAQDVKG